MRLSEYPFPERDILVPGKSRCLERICDSSPSYLMFIAAFMYAFNVYR